MFYLRCRKGNQFQWLPCRKCIDSQYCASLLSGLRECPLLWPFMPKKPQKTDAVGPPGPHRTLSPVQHVALPALALWVQPDRIIIFLGGVPFFPGLKAKTK
jgi:hypothetical protein